MGEAGESPATGAVPGAGCAEGVLAGGVFAGVAAGGVDVVLAGGLADGEGSDCGVDCPQHAVANTNANPAEVAAKVAVLKPVILLVMPSPPGQCPISHAASLDTLDASIRLLAAERKNISLLPNKLQLQPRGQADFPYDLCNRRPTLCISF